MKKPNHWCHACVCVLLLGCTPKTQTTEQASLIGEKEKAIFNETGFPIVKEPIVLSAIASRNPMHGDFNQMPSIDQIEQKAGITLDFEQIPSSSYSEKLNLLFASGSLPDMIFYGEPNNLMSYAGELVRPLDAYIERYMPNLLRVFAQRPQYRRFLVRSDGNIYQLLRSEEYSQIQTPNNLFINKLWLDKLGLAVPETTEELYRALKAFKERDPNGNGRADEIPSLSFTPDEEAELATLRTDIGDYFYGQYTKWVTQGANVRSNWPGFVRQLEAIGIERYIAIHQIAYNRYRGEP